MNAYLRREKYSVILLDMFSQLRDDFSQHKCMPASFVIHCEEL